MMDIVFRAIMYVLNGEAFWHTIGFTVATAIFIGAAIYDGDTTMLKKGFITIFCYTMVLFLTNVFRLIGNGGNIGHIQRYAGIITLIFVTVAYLTGMVIGVKVVEITRRKVGVKIR